MIAAAVMVAAVAILFGFRPLFGLSITGIVIDSFSFSFSTVIGVIGVGVEGGMSVSFSTSFAISISMSSLSLDLARALRGCFSLRFFCLVIG